MNIQSNLQSAHGLPSGGSVGKTSSASPAAASGESSAPAADLKQDHARLSQAAVLASASSALPEVRSDKVASIQQAIANGSYSVSSSEVAGKMIDHLLGNS